MGPSPRGHPALAGWCTVALELSGALEGQQLRDLRVHAEQIDLTYLRRLVPLPDLVGGRATLQVQLAGTLAEPSLQGDLLLQPESPQHLPFERVHTTLAKQLALTVGQVGP